MFSGLTKNLLKFVIEDQHQWRSKWSPNVWKISFEESTKSFLSDDLLSAINWSLFTLWNSIHCRELLLFLLTSSIFFWWYPRDMRQFLNLIRWLGRRRIFNRRVHPCHYLRIWIFFLNHIHQSKVLYRRKFRRLKPRSLDRDQWFHQFCRSF